VTQAAQGAVIALHRPLEATNAGRRYKIYVDGVKVAAVRVGKTIEIPVTPGEHRVKAKLDWCSSPEVVINVVAGQPSNLAVETVGPIYAMLANQLFRPSRYLALVSATG
jgi:hypothetical protein